MSNDGFREIEQYIKTDGSTPVIIGNEFDWISTTALQGQRAILGSMLNLWRDDLENLESAQFLNHYSVKDHRSQDSGMDSWTDHNLHLDLAEDSPSISIRNLSILTYPDNHEIVVMSFVQEYISKSYHSSSPKTLYWQKEGGDLWKIIHES